MEEKSIIIIGAGLAGLSTGCYAQMNGYRSHIFEHHTKPGGVAAAWKRKRYLIDGGIHFLMGHRPGQPIHDLYRELGTARSDCCTDLIGFHFIDEASGVEIDITSDLDRLANDLKGIAPDDAKVIDNLIGSAHAIQGGITSFEATTSKCSGARGGPSAYEESPRPSRASIPSLCLNTSKMYVAHYYARY